MPLIYSISASVLHVRRMSLRGRTFLPPWMQRGNRNEWHVVCWVADSIASHCCIIDRGQRERIVRKDGQQR